MRNILVLHTLGLYWGQVHLQKADLRLNSKRQGGQEQRWRIIDYPVIKCHSHFHVSQLLLGQGESEEETNKEEIT